MNRCFLESLLERNAVVVLRPQLWKLGGGAGAGGVANLPLGFLLLSPAKKEIGVKPAEVFTAGSGPLNERLPC